MIERSPWKTRSISSTLNFQCKEKSRKCRCQCYFTAVLVNKEQSCSQKWKNRNSDRPCHNDFQGLITAEHLIGISSCFKKKCCDKKLSLTREESVYMEKFSEISNILPRIYLCSGWLVGWLIMLIQKKKGR